MLERYFAAEEPLSADTAWMHVYRLLLWIDPTTGLAHCYESDKAQPGRHWYGRSLAFHAWVSRELSVVPEDLRDLIDWLFKQGAAQLEASLPAIRERWRLQAERQRKPYAELGLPEPGEDPQLEEIIQLALEPWLSKPLPSRALEDLAIQVRTHLKQENKRKNLVGEGFEDVLSAIVTRLPRSQRIQVLTRRLLSQIPGFSAPAKGEKERKVDMVIVDPSGHRSLVSAKWSVRADREEQFEADFESYVRHEVSGKPFDFVLVTNEFDAARLIAACRRRSGIMPMFKTVVHVNPSGVMAAYGPELRRSASELPQHLSTGRLVSLAQWLSTVGAHS
jgi:hypothetical protein